ncbi:hypothetical protein [Catellatospora methionotrophica]|uniref:hypothetical protein n=1 Tax=Catellatospora methionotrophica TaxID=121620 RepID=UPI0033FE8C62
MTVTRSANGELHLFGVDVQGKVWRREQVAGTVNNWYVWNEITDRAMKQLAAETNADGRIELVGVMDSGEVWHRTQVAPNSGSFTPWSSLFANLRP